MQTFVLLHVLALVASVRAAAPGLHDCPTNNTVGKSACPDSAQCCIHQYFGAEGCIFANTSTCCAPGPALEPSPTLPNCLIIGDSVSDQYTPTVADLLKDVCQVQHSPWVGGGSANDAANGEETMQSFQNAPNELFFLAFRRRPVQSPALPLAANCNKARPGR